MFSIYGKVSFSGMVVVFVVTVICVNLIIIKGVTFSSRPTLYLTHNHYGGVFNLFLIVVSVAKWFA